MSGAVSVAVVKRLARIQTAVLSDVLYEMGYDNQVLAPDLKPVGSGGRFAGPALCVSGLSVAEARRHSGKAPTTFEIDRAVTPGAVVVFASKRQPAGSVIGGLMAFSFSRAGAAGVVTDGGVRDAEEYGLYNLPCVAAFVTPASSKGLWTLTTLGEPVTLPGPAGREVLIEPGDIVCADPDGVIVVPAALAEDVAADAETIEVIERRIMLMIEAGRDREEAFAANDRFSHIRRRR